MFGHVVVEVPPLPGFYSDLRRLARDGPRLPGMLALLLGLGGVLFGSLSFIVALALRFGFERVFPDTDGRSDLFLHLMHALDTIWLTHGPIWVLLGALLAWKGRQMMRGDAAPGTIVTVLVVAAMADLGAYLWQGSRDYAPTFERLWRMNGGDRLLLPVHPFITFTLVFGSMTIVALFVPVAILAWRAGRSGETGRGE